MMKRSDYLVLAEMAEECLKRDAYIDSRSAFVLIRTLAQQAAARGQRKPLSTAALHQSTKETK